MGELRFVGLGLGDERDLSARALRAIRTSTEIFWEEYTGRVAEGSRARLEEAIGRPVRTLDRAEVESGAPLRAALDAGGTVALLVAGDPFVATTHVALRSSAAESGHRWRYFPNATVLSAVPGLLGLMPYRFGRTVSVPFPADGFRPRSPLAAIVANRAAGLHSLALLDLDPAGGRYLTAPEAIERLTEMDDEARPQLPPEEPWCVAARVGAEDARGWWAPRSELLRTDFGAPLHAVVVPAPALHFEEERALRLWRVGPTGAPGPAKTPGSTAPGAPDARARPRTGAAEPRP